MLLSRDFKSIFTHENASYETSISCKKSLARWILLVAKKAIQNYFPISHEKTYYKGSGTSILTMKSTSMLLGRAGVWRLGPGKVLGLAKGVTEKLFFWCL